MEKLNMILRTHWKNISAIVLILALLLCSCTVFADRYTDPQTYKKTIQSIDEKKVTVLAVSAAIAGSATLLAAVPDDATTPLAEEMMDLSSYLVAVICVLVLEKSLLTVFGAASCYILIPAACLLALIFIATKRRNFMAWAIKITVLALAFLIIVPCAMRLSDYIYEVNQASFESESNSSTDTPSTDSENKKDLPWYKKLWDSITDAVKETTESALEKGKKALSDFTDSVSVFIIAYCAIPVFVVFLFLWLLKFLFGLNINVNIENLNVKKSIKKLRSKPEDSI